MARRNAWLTPDTETGEAISRCLTFPRSMLPHVTGALSALTEVWRWEQYGDMSPDTAAQFATVMLDQFVSECGANMQVRQNELNPCALEFSNDQGVTWFEFANLSLCATEPKPDRIDYEDIRENPVTGEPEFSLDGGITWTDIPTPSGTPPVNPWTPPLEPIAASDDTERICIAASTAVYNLSEMYRQTYGAIGAGVLNTLDGLNDFLYDLNHFLAEIVWGQYYDVIAALGFFEDYEPTQYTAVALDSSAQQSLLCLLIENATAHPDNTVTFDFGAVRDNTISELGVNPGTAVWTHLNYVQEAGLNRLGSVGFAAPMDCDQCIPGWNALDGYGLRGMQLLAFGTCSAPGTYDTANDKIDGGQCIIGGDAVSGLRVRHTFDPVTINSIIVRWTQGHYNNKGFDVRLFRNGTQVGHQYFANNVYDMTRTFSFGGVVADRFDMEMWSKIPGTVHPTLNIQRITINGTGTPPPF